MYEFLRGFLKMRHAKEKKWSHWGCLLTLLRRNYSNGKRLPRRRWSHDQRSDLTRFRDNTVQKLTFEVVGALQQVVDHHQPWPEDLQNLCWKW